MSHLGNQPAGTRERIVERRLKAFELRIAGASFRKIARALGIGEAQAHRDVMARLRETAALEDEVRENLRRLEVERLDALLIAHWAKATGGDDAATRTCLRIMERRAALLGLDVMVADGPQAVQAALAGAVIVAALGAKPEYIERLQQARKMIVDRANGQDREVP